MASDEWDDDEFEEMSDEEMELLFSDGSGSAPEPEEAGKTTVEAKLEASTETDTKFLAEEGRVEMRVIDGVGPVDITDDARATVEAEVEAYRRMEQQCATCGTPPEECPQSMLNVEPEPPAAPSQQQQEQQVGPLVDIDQRIRTQEETIQYLISENQRIIGAIEKMPAFLIQALQTGQLPKYMVEQAQAAPPATMAPAAAEMSPSSQEQPEDLSGPVEITQDVGRTMLSSQEMHLPQAGGGNPPAVDVTGGASAAVTPGSIAGSLAAGALGSGIDMNVMTNFINAATNFATNVLGIGRGRAAKQQGMNTQGLQDFMNVMQQFMSLNAGFKNMQAMEMEQTTKHLGRMFRMMGTNLVGMMQTMSQEQEEEEKKGDGSGKPAVDAYTIPAGGGDQEQ